MELDIARSRLHSGSIAQASAARKNLVLNKKAEPLAPQGLRLISSGRWGQGSWGPACWPYCWPAGSGPRRLWRSAYGASGGWASSFCFREGSQHARTGLVKCRWWSRPQEL